MEMCSVSIHDKLGVDHPLPVKSPDVLFSEFFQNRLLTDFYPEPFGFVLTVVLRFAVFQKFPSVKGKYCG